MAVAGAGASEYMPTSDPRDLYHNLVVVVDEAASLNNGQPGALARWMDALEVKPGERVYHLGCGVGYYTAILAEVCGPSGNVAAAEVRADLAARARENLAPWPQVAVHCDDGTAVDPGPCDAMLINAGVTHPLPAWLDRLRPGGRIVLPLTISMGTTGLGQGVMARITREANGYSARMVSFVAIFSCTNARDPAREPLLKNAFVTGNLLKMKSVRRDAHESAETCIIHGADVCLSAASLP